MIRINFKRNILKCIWFFLVSTFYLLPSALYSFEPGYPKLVWEKEYPFEIDEIVMADESGDVLLSDKDSEQLILIDPQGNKRLHLGPKLNGYLASINISRDGNKIMYCKKDYQSKSENVFTTSFHIISRKGEKIFEKKENGYPILSPNGEWFVLEIVTPEGEMNAYDLSGKLLWEKPDIRGLVFTQDSNYFLSWTATSIGAQKITFHTYNRQGEMKWEEKEVVSRIYGQIGIGEAAKGGYLVWNDKKNNRRNIYNHLGNVIIEIPIDVNKAFIAPDGSAVMFQYEDKFKVLTLPDKNVKFEKNIIFIEAKISNAGKYLVGIRKTTADKPENIIIYNIEDGTQWGKQHANKSPSLFINVRGVYPMNLIDYYMSTCLSDNGKYLLVIEHKNNRIFYYKIYN